jgi:hypothetical protein
MEGTVGLLDPSRRNPERLTGTRIDGHRERQRTYLAGRVCEEDGCDTVLSRYNARARCWQHELARPYLVRGRRNAANDLDVLRDLTLGS